MSNTPTYDQLSALCAQMAAALEDAKFYVDSEIERDHHPSVVKGAKETQSEVDTTLTAYRTLSPDPVWQRVLDEKFVRAASIRFGEVYLRHADTVTTADLAAIENAMFSAMRHAANRARGEG